MTAAHAKILLEQTNCPACGAAKREQTNEAFAPAIAMVQFECTASFATANDQIIVSKPCPGPSRTAAMLMNHQAEVT
ncbi:hypothetical protein ACU5AY_05900 [Rhizobium sp. PAMB 3174]